MTLPTQQVGHCLHTSVVDAGVLRRLHVIPQQLQGVVVKHGAFLNWEQLDICYVLSST